jgi:hypothetical protein
MISIRRREEDDLQRLHMVRRETEIFRDLKAGCVCLSFCNHGLVSDECMSMHFAE